MKKKIAGVILGTLAVGLPAVAASPVSASNQSEGTYRVEFTNTTSGQYFTPPNFAGHSQRVDVFEPGEEASPGVQAVAENGATTVLADELTEAVDDSSLGVSGVGGEEPIAPGETVTFEFTTENNYLSIVSMIICTNDGFGGIDSERLPSEDGESETFGVQDYDAGTEVNTELRSDIVGAPFCGDGEGSGESDPDLAEDGVITRHGTLRGVGDLDPSLDWPRGGDVASVTVTRVAS